MWDGDRVATRASIAVSRAPSGARLRDTYLQCVRSLTFGLARVRGTSVVVGPLTLLLFGTPKVTRYAVEWPIEGGLLARRPGGTLRVAAAQGRVESSVRGFTPRLPRWLYLATQLQVHELFTRLYLLRVRGPEPPPGPPVTAPDRFQAASVDVAFCLTMTGFPVRRRFRRTLLVLAAYHVVCWTLGGRTLGGLVVRQRVVATDGSALTLAQAMLRLALAPLSWLTGRPVHDEISGTTVIAD